MTEDIDPDALAESINELYEAEQRLRDDTPTFALRKVVSARKRLEHQTADLQTHE